jgi:pimeloyl-ACP methyl ester carboxylesterase
MPRFPHGDVQLAYEIAGPPGGVPIVLVHGLGDSRRLWDGVTTRLCAERSVLTYDLRGHGESDAPPDPDLYSMPIFIEDLLDLLDSLALARVLLVGFSLGGAVAFHFALAHPDRTAGLAVINANAAARDPAEQAAMRDAEMAGRSGMSLMSGGERRWVDRLLERLPPGARLAAVVGRDASVVDRAGEFQMPVWLIASDRDPGFARRSADMVGRLPRGHRIVIEGAGHAVMLDQPAALTASLLEFVRAID